MRDNNLIKNLSKENAASVVFHLFNRHDYMGDQYRRIATELEEKGKENLSNWFNSLAGFRKDLSNELRPLVADMGNVPMKPSRQMKYYFDGKEEEIMRLIDEGDVVRLVEKSWEAESSVAAYYQEIEANKDIPLPIRNQLKRQHDQLAKVIRKAERLRTVPEPNKMNLVI